MQHFFLEYDKKTKEYYIYMEFVSKGNLAEEIYENRKYEDELKKKLYKEKRKNKEVEKALEEYYHEKEHRVKIFTKQILRGLEYLHCVKEIVHRDIKPENILIHEDSTLKISDFGESKFLQRGNAQTMKGTVLYMAPEILNVRGI